LEGTWLDRVIIGRAGAAGQRVFAGDIFNGHTNVVICDDNIKTMVTRDKPIRLEDVFEKACTMMDHGDMTLWGLSHSGYISEGATADLTTLRTNALIYGALFGFRASANHHTLHGDVRDDIETSLRHYVRGGICRFVGFHVKKQGDPGAFKDGGGGISSGLTAESHAAAKAEGKEALLKEFPEYIKSKRGKFDIGFRARPVPVEAGTAELTRSEPVGPVGPVGPVEQAGSTAPVEADNSEDSSSYEDDPEEIRKDIIDLSAKIKKLRTEYVDPTTSQERRVTIAREHNAKIADLKARQEALYAFDESGSGSE
jgi:hypothetical protein